MCQTTPNISTILETELGCKGSYITAFFRTKIRFLQYSSFLFNKVQFLINCHCFRDQKLQLVALHNTHKNPFVVVLFNLNINSRTVTNSTGIASHAYFIKPFCGKRQLNTVYPSNILFYLRKQAVYQMN